MQEADPSRALWRAWNTVNAAYSTFAREQGANETELCAVYALWDKPEGCTQRQLAAEIFTSKQTTSALVARMRKRGWLDASVGGDDARERVVRLTGKGRTHYEGTISRLRRAEAAAARAVGAVDVEACAAVLEGYARELGEAIS